MRIIHLRAENVKRLKAVEITPDPDDPLVIIGGRNAQGKTSVLDAIWLALCGGKASRQIDMPVRAGTDQAEVIVDLGDYVVTRKWRDNETTSLTVTSTRDGAKLSSPQQLLDRIVGAVTFDPLAFVRGTPTHQRLALEAVAAKFTEFDFIAADRERREWYDARTDVAREARSVAARLDQWVPPPVDTDMTVADAQIASQRALDAMQTWERAKAQTVAADRAVETAEANVEAQTETVQQLEAKLALARTRHMELQQTLADSRFNREMAYEFADSLEDPVAEFAAAQELIETASRADQARSDRVARNLEAERFSALTFEVSECTSKIEAIDIARRAALAAAKLPVEGLDVGDDGVTIAGIPFGQASAAEQLKVAMAVAMAGNPDVRVIRIMDGSLLDEDSMMAIADLATTHDFQVWVERVGDGDASVVIEDGWVQS